MSNSSLALVLGVGSSLSELPGGIHSLMILQVIGSFHSTMEKCLQGKAQKATMPMCSPRAHSSSPKSANDPSVLASN